jgi:predicted metallo-beta-lactamase superfamily hydrolase
VPVTTEQILTAGGVLAPIVAGAFASWMKSLHASVKELAEQSTETAKSVAVMHTALVGINGDNGLNSEVKGLRKRVHDLGSNINTIANRQDVMSERLDRFEDKIS